MVFEVGDTFRVHNGFYCGDCRGKIKTITEIDEEDTLITAGTYHKEFIKSEWKHISLVSKGKITNWKKQLEDKK